MSEIKFRALAKDGTWRYGSYPCLNVDMGNTMYPMDMFWNNFLNSFKRETLGRWTGLSDKLGKEIYEGDILADTSPDVSYILGIVTYNETPDCIYAGSFYLTDKDGYASDWDDIEPEHWHNYEVVGDVYRNPELLEVE